MSFKNILLPVLALASAVVADSDCTLTATATVTSPGDVASLAACTAIAGDIVFKKGAADAQAAVSLTNTQVIKGNVKYDSDDVVQTFSAPQLTAIGSLSFSNLSALHSTSLSQLQTIDSLDFTGCSVLTDLGVGKIGPSLKSLSIINTLVKDVNAFSDIQAFGSITVTGNRNLADITLNAAMVNSNISFAANNPGNSGYSVKLTNMTYAGAINIQNATNVSIPILTGVAQEIFLYGNGFDTFSAPNLTYAGGLYLHSNPKLANLSLPVLQQVNGSRGAFDIANNTKLLSIDGFPKLKSVANNVNFYGGFTNVSTGAFTEQGAEVKGAFNVYSSQDITDACKAINSLKSSNVIKGGETCKGLSKEAGTTTNTGGGGSGTGTSSGSGSSTSSSGAANPSLAIPKITFGAGVFAGVLQLLLSF